MRGWNNRLVGPQAQGDALGGDILYAGGVHLTFPFPKLSQYGVRGHIFGNAGNVGQFSEGLEKLFADSRVSVGMGLIIPVMNARLELNYVHGLLKKSSDQVHSFHWGIGLDFV